MVERKSTKNSTSNIWTHPLDVKFSLVNFCFVTEVIPIALNITKVFGTE